MKRNIGILCNFPEGLQSFPKGNKGEKKEKEEYIMTLSPGH